MPVPDALREVTASGKTSHLFADLTKKMIGFRGWLFYKKI